jgi:AcrR family transcriptional regulator
MDSLGTERTSRLLQAVFRLYSEPGLHRPSVRDIVKAARIGSKLIYYWYGDIETLYRFAVGRHVDALTAGLSGSAPAGGGPRDTILHYTRICAALFASEDYRRLAYLVMRDGPFDPWLVRKHERDVVERVQAGLARVVGEARTPPATRLEIRSSGTRAFVRRLQSELALPMLMPRQKGPTHMEIRFLVERTSDEALKAVYSTNAVATALDQLVRQPASQPRPPVPARAPRSLEAAA